MEELILKLINQGEKINTEFKESRSQLPENIFQNYKGYKNYVLS